MSATLDATAWMEQGECTKYNPEIFTGDKPVKSEWYPICRACPVRDTCFNYAVINNESGIWGGTTERQRKNLSPIFLRAIGQYRPDQSPSNPERDAIQTLVQQAHEQSQERTKQLRSDLSELLQSLQDIS